MKAGNDEKNDGARVVVVHLVPTGGEYEGKYLPLKFDIPKGFTAGAVEFQEDAQMRHERDGKFSMPVADAYRLDHLEQTIKACSDTDIYYDEGNEDQPWVMEVAGCDFINFRATSIRELIDQSIAFDASGEDFETWQEQNEIKG